MKHQISYRGGCVRGWPLRGCSPPASSASPLAERDINLSLSQIHRLATGIPELLSLPVLAALCDTSPPSFRHPSIQGDALLEAITTSGIGH
jgi:hypothetical protein